MPTSCVGAKKGLAAAAVDSICSANNLATTYTSKARTTPRAIALCEEQSSCVNTSSLQLSQLSPPSLVVEAEHESGLHQESSPVLALSGVSARALLDAVIKGLTGASLAQQGASWSPFGVPCALPPQHAQRAAYKPKADVPSQCKIICTVVCKQWYESLHG